MTVINYTLPGQYVFVVPAGITEVQFDVRGAGGGAYGGGYGGRGARVIARKTVTPGDNIFLNVGGRGLGPVRTSGGLGGYNGGGRGGNATGYGGQPGCGGGGASDVRYGGNGLANRICIAGGGGGAGRNPSSKSAGGKGGTAGATAYAGASSGVGRGGPGLGGSQAAGGAGGVHGTGTTTNGVAGASGNGGRGGDHTQRYAKAGGGGGGGYFGGGGGSGTTVTNPKNVTSGGGGGGSSYTGGMDVTSYNVAGGGALAGANGLIVVTYGVVWTAGGAGGADGGSAGVGDHPGQGGTQVAGGAAGAGGGSYTAGGAGKYGQGGAGATGGGGGGGGGLFGGGGGAWNTGVSPEHGGTGGGGSNFGGDLVNTANTPAPDGSNNGYCRITWDVPAVAVIPDPLTGAGDLITRDHQYEYNGLLFGSGTDYISEGWNGLFDAVPNVTSNDLTPQDRHGVIPGLDLLGGRTLDNVIDIKDDDRTSSATIFDRAESLQKVFRVKQQEYPLVYQLPGRPKRFVMARPRKAAMPKDADLTLGLGKASVQLFASDPAHYDLAPSGFSALQRTNLILNPGAEVDTTWWEDGGNCTLTRSVTHSYVGASSFQLTATANGDMTMETTDIGSGVTEGLSYAVQFRAQADATARTVLGQFVWLDSDGDPVATVNAAGVVDGVGGWVQGTLIGVAPAGAVALQFAVTVQGSLTGEIHYIDAVLLEQSTIVDTYFNGDSVDTATSAFDWAGDAGESVSYQYDLNYYMGAGVTELELDITVGGTWFTKPIIQIDGVGNGWKLEVLEQDDLDGESDVGATWMYKSADDPSLFTSDRHTHIMDMKDTAYTLDTVASYQLVDFSSDWWRLFPGVNKIRISRNDNDYAQYSAAISISWHTSWMY